MKTNKNFIGALVLMFCSLNGTSQLYDFDTHTFTNASSTGKDGPSLAACQAAYAAEVWELDGSLFNMTTNGVQEWTVPVTGDYEIEANGGQGGNDLYTAAPEVGGLGARMVGTFSLTEGDVLYIVVGQQGENTRVTGADNAAAGGGGGSFVWDPLDTSVPLIAGGGGAGGSGHGYTGRNATDAEDAQNSFSLVNGGLSGNGGRLNNTGSSYWGGGGAGWLTNGTAGNHAVLYDYDSGGGVYGSAQGGRRPLEGAVGGVRWNDGTDEGGDGGFGGGGAGGSDNMGTGGGGGYSGGGGQNGTGADNSGGGGGSYNDGIDQTNTAAVNSGHGSVTITLLCNPLTVTAFESVLCDGDEIILEATAESGEAVTWDLGVVDGVSFAPPIGTTTYTGTTIEVDDCSFQATITVNALPTVTASVDDDEICLGDEFVFTGGGAISYVWDMGVTDGVAFEPLSDGTDTYTVTGTDGNGCVNSAFVEGTVHVLPTVTASVDDDEICLEDVFVFTGGGATSYVWDMGVTDGVAFEPASDGAVTYTVVGTDDNGCVNSASVVGTVHALPTVIASVDDDEICYGESVIFTGSGAITYTWDLGVIDGESYTPADEGTTSYTVIGTDANGCQGTDLVDVTVNPEIIISYTTVDETLDDGEIDLTVTGGTPGYTYDWDTDEADDFDDPEDLTDLEAGFYTVVVRDANDCEKEEIIEILLLCTPLTVTVSEDVVCETELLLLDATSESGADITWDGGVTDGVEFYPEATGVITFTATSDDPADCPYSVVVEVLASPTVNPTIGGELYCDGDEIVLGAGGDADTYSWDPLDLTPDVGVTTYTLTGTYDLTGCSRSESIDVTVNELPDVIATADVEQICAGGSVTLNGVGASEYSWDPADIEDGELYWPEGTGTYTYTVTGTDENGCINMDDIAITVAEEIVISYTTVGEVLGSDGEINITVTGGMPTFVYDWSNDGTGDFDDTEDLTGLTSGIYVVVVEGEAGCSASETIVLKGQVGVIEEVITQVNVYPNPTIDQVTIKYEGEFNYTLFDIAGSIILSGIAVDQEALSLKEIPAGMYIVKIQNGQTTQAVTLIKN